MAADVSARVHLVAEKLQQKAQDAQRKGNESAARGLSSSVSDLRDALALISELRHLLTRRRGEGDDAEDDADVHVQELVTRLAKVETMLNSKSRDMKSKGNENAAVALQQSADAVDKGRVLLLEQQQTIFGLLGRWETLEDVVMGREGRISDGDINTAHGQLIAKVRHFEQVGALVEELLPGNDVRKEIEKLQKAQEDAIEAGEMLKQESLALEEARQELESQRQKWTLRQEEDVVLLEQQREACQAMEELVRESDQEIQRMTKERTEEVQSLRVELESLALEKERLVRVHYEEVEELQAQLASAMDAISSKAEETELFQTKELEALQIKMGTLTLEKEDLVKSHAKEMEALRRQLENATALTVAKDDGELQLLQAKFDELVSEKEDLIKIHADDSEKLHQMHVDEMEDLRRQLSMQSNENATINTDELQSLYAQIDNLAWEKKNLIKMHADSMEELQQEHAREIECLHRQVTNLSKSESSTEVDALADDAEELQSLRDAINNLMLEKEIVVQSHASELKKLHETHLGEIEALQHQLHDATAALTVNTDKVALNADELQQLRAEVGALTIEKDNLVKEHADGVEKLSHLRVEGDSIESRRVSKDHEGYAVNDEDDMENNEIGDVPVMELHEEGGYEIADIADEDEVETSLSDADIATQDVKNSSEVQVALVDLQTQLAECDERLQAQRDINSALEREQIDLQEQVELLTNEKAQSIDELQRVHEAEASELQTRLDDLQVRLVDYEQHTEEQQNTIMALEKEQQELEGRIAHLTAEKTQTPEALQITHREETTRLAQCIGDNEALVEALSAQLQETQNTLTTKAAEQSEAADALQRSRAELHTCRSELDDQICECSRLTSALEAFQNAENVKNVEVDERLSQLTGELHELVLVLSANDKTDAARAFIEHKWQSTEVAELSSGIAAVLTDLVSVQDQLNSTEHKLELSRNECDSQKLMFGEFMKTSDWRLFAKDNEVEEEVVELLESGENASELLAVAKANIVRWLEELQQLRQCVANDSVRLEELKQEKQQEQEQLVTLEESKQDLQVLVESLRKQLANLQSEKESMAKAAKDLKDQSHCASVQEQQQQVAQQKEVTELQQQLATMRSEFERYRVRSHAALKKMERRAELLNGMRKENETLQQQVQESDKLRDQADAARKDSEAQLLEVQRTQEMMQADFDQVVMQKTRAIAEIEEEQQRLELEQEQTNQQIEKLTCKVQELEIEKNRIEGERERIQKAEHETFQARLDTAAVTAQAAKQDLQQVCDALKASKAENEKRQKLIESLELKLEHPANILPVVDTVAEKTHTSTVFHLPLTMSSSIEAKKYAAELEKEVISLKASESSLKRQLDDALAELIALQERFATTKAANAEKVFSLEERVNQRQMEVVAATEEMHRLTAVLETQKSAMLQSKTNSTLSETSLDQTNELVGQQLTAQIQELKTELADANTEIALLTSALQTCREDLQEARDHIGLLTSEPESGEDPASASKASKVLAAKDDALKKLRVQVLELQEELQTLHKEKATLELHREQEELDELHASRKHMQSEKERAMQLQRRQTVVSGFEKQVATIVDELQQRLEDHSSAFREVCDFRDEHRVALFSDKFEGVLANAAVNSVETEFEECLVMRSGVVIKAGATFQLPVICEKRGWRVVWNFSVKEDAADVIFRLSTTMTDATSTEVEIVSPERMNEMSSVFEVEHDNTTLVFEWDNSFSWLNEKTLDYHVSIQEPLTPQAQKVRRNERDLQTKAKLLQDGLKLIQTETDSRSLLSATLMRLDECEATKDKHLEQFDARKTQVLSQKTSFQEEMDAQKAAFSAMLREQDELEDVERSITRAWEAAVAEREDVEMTLQLAGNGAQLETFAHDLEEQMRSVAEQLKNPIPDVKVEGSQLSINSEVNDEVG